MKGLSEAIVKTSDIRQVELPSWLRSDAFRLLEKSLDNIAPWRFVGGVVRDVLLDKVALDIDIAIAAEPEKVFNQLRADNIKVVPTGLQHGTVSVYEGSNSFEITSLREDVVCNGRHAQVSFTSNWQADASRRDFTINAMYLDVNGNLYDYFGGYQHLQERRLVFVGEPAARVREDYLRILRYWRFLAVFGVDQIDDDSQKAAVDMCDGLAKIAGERIKEEMFKMLAAPFALQVINIMIDRKVLAVIGLDLQVRVPKFTSQALLNLALLLSYHPGGVNERALEKVSTRWRLSNLENKILHEMCLPKIAIDWSASLDEHKKYMYRLGRQKYMMRYLLATAKQNIKQDFSKELMGYHLPVFPLKGGDVKQLGLAGKAIGQALKDAESHWVEGGFSSEKEELLLYIKRICSI